MTTASTTEGRDQALHARLKRLVRDLPRAKLARGTGRSRTALTRYLQGAKVPLEFGTALVEEFGINPAWLHTGEEPIYLADVPASSANLGNDLLDMMRAMDNVSRLKLGSLTGAGHARALREVSDMLDRYGSMRDRLNRMSAPLLTDLIDQAEQAIDAREVDRSRVLLKAAARIQQFCDDPALSHKMLEVSGLLHHIEQDLETALDLRARTYRMTLSDDAKFKDIASSSTELALVLRNALFARRAQRVARVGKAYATEEDRRTTAFAQLCMVDVMASVELGEFEGIPQAIEHAVDVFGDRSYAPLESAKFQYSLYRGIWQPEEVAGVPAATFAAASNILSSTLTTDDADVIERALKRCREVMQPQMLLNQFHVQRGELVLRALRGKPVPPEHLELPANERSF